MKFFLDFAVQIVRYRAAHCPPEVCRAGTEMCKRLGTKVLHLALANCDGPFVSQEARIDVADILSCTLKALQDGHVVAVPTDTIYGLACLAQNSGAVRKLYDIKGRNEQKPLAICVGEIHDIYRYCKVEVKEELLSDLLPGPVTLVLERSEILNKELNPFTSLVGIRIPDCGFMRRLCQMCGEPLALTSANVSAQNSTVAVHEFHDLWPKLAVVVDGGPIEDQSRLGSTVVDLSAHGRYRIIRAGWLPQLLSLDGRPDLGFVPVVPKFFHFQICALTQSGLRGLQRIP
ncbi:yrdC domain-containing protein, mitochondrial isoform X2 [Phyllopteryx taeniolatus]|uniref:yrdC domain-containing protein, mitochondrial isoform X2 n=1 Tax=Phyllopteryx taeniolatus TaxID=161469 RepID=UPI002AD1F4AE|nr:yrdC domain-containing protein, mitochondrial isoform X2 [Phyllopteryx taeniolatus]